MPEIRALPARGGGTRNYGLPFTLDGIEKEVSIRIEGLNRSLVEDLPDISLDLLEIAALVYGCDAAVSRGGPVDTQLGRAWYRDFQIEIPVRCQNLWTRADVSAALSEVLSFVSGDRFKFAFTAHPGAGSHQGFFKFSPDDGWQADRVMMFSGGLDSFAGALEEMFEQKQQVALVSHFSATKIAPRQKALKAALESRCGPKSCKHFPVKIQLGKGGNKETTYRTRSFLFAVLGMIVAQSFGRNRVSFYENGVVSLNLAPVANVVSTRATRTTHPKTLDLMTRFFQLMFERPAKIDNPYFWRTKTDVVETIARLGLGDQIRVTNSCADTRNRTEQHPHCGRCSQCIDRRFAMLAAGLEHEDPEEAYAVDLMRGARREVRDREIALSYVRNALDYEVMAPPELQAFFPEMTDAIGSLGVPPQVGLEQVSALLQRHGNAVAGVMRAKAPTDPAPESLPALFGGAQREPRLRTGPRVPVSPSPVQQARLILTLQSASKITMNNRIELTGPATVRLLTILAEQHLQAAGAGLDPFDYPCAEAGKLARLLGVTDESLRRQISRMRGDLRKRLASADLDLDKDFEIIENVPWSGYRLAPDRVDVRRKT